MSLADLLGTRARPPRNAIDVSEEAGVRYLHFGSEWIQGAMRIARPYALELEYTREMMLPLLFAPDEQWPARVLVIGLGAASVTKFLHRYCPQSSLTVVEIDPRMPAVAAMHFRLPAQDGRLNIVIDDGVKFVAQSDAQWDLILVDGYDHRARAKALDSEAFHRDCLARLAPGGRVCLNLFGRTRGFRKSARRIFDAYAGRALVLPSLDEGNAICVAVGEQGVDTTLDEVRNQARLLRSHSGLNLAPALSRMEQAGLCPGGRLVI
ncbi:MAG: fused MFS/spermidine synthase [Gammaproteobacteria bacterium]|nr:fused MFS/spermidine synthase [Gammaproteobacteria bacterium]MBU0771887.1 fused MFS/spermidine synthase [Gammaproteobacteria bacterium]MBU0856092.1 fused MFS/spermidine synthase [Gammaproteobacteria bacterium]MBU1846205.1 fused MFS/spermidine synthase [Gammaproteobacteria bacterium]